MNFPFFSIVVFLAGLHCASQAVPLAPLQDVPVVQCQDGEVTLQVAVYRWDVDGQLSFTTRAYHYQGQPMIPGPTVVMKGGRRCNITVVNALPTATPVGSCSYHSNDFHCPDTTNLHTHGLHVSPNQDDVSTSITPGQTFTYTYDLPDDHLWGTFWYHAHHHGSSNLQLAGGLAGALLVEPAAGYSMPSDLAALYQTARTLVLQHVFFNNSVPGNDVSFTMLDYPASSRAMLSAPEAYESVPPQPTFAAGGATDFYVVNGQYQPVVSIQPDAVVLLRLVHATGVRQIELEMLDPNGWCQWQTIARDGVPHYTPYQQPLAVVMTPGNRADIAVRCAAAADGQTIVVRAFPNPLRDPALGTMNRHSQAVVFALQVSSSTGIAGPSAFPASAAPLPSYLATLMGETPVSGGLSVPNILLSGTGSGTQQAVNFVPFPGFHAPFEQRYVDRLCLDRVYDYNIVPPGFGENASLSSFETSAHPYHQHVNHFQIVNLNGVNATAAADVIRIGEWRDTVPAFPPNGVKIRLKPLLYTGDMMMHCHMLQHEDRGMMALYHVAAADSSTCVYTPPATTAAAPVGSGAATTGVPGGISGVCEQPLEPPVERQVIIGDNYFLPREVTIRACETIRWYQNGYSYHSVTSGFPVPVGQVPVASPVGPGREQFESGRLSRTNVFTYTFNTPGNYSYLCRYHSGMTAKVIVLPALPPPPPPPASTGTTDTAALTTDVAAPPASATSSSDAAAGGAMSTTAAGGAHTSAAGAGPLGTTAARAVTTATHPPPPPLSTSAQLPAVTTSRASSVSSGGDQNRIETEGGAASVSALDDLSSSNRAAAIAGIAAGGALLLAGAVVFAVVLVRRRRESYQFSPERSVSRRGSRRTVVAAAPAPSTASPSTVVAPDAQVVSLPAPNVAAAAVQQSASPTAATSSPPSSAAPDAAAAAPANSAARTEPVSATDVAQGSSVVVSADERTV